MKKILFISITSLVFILVLFLGTNVAKAANVDLVTKTMSPTSYDRLQVRYLQKELNSTINSNLDTDGIYGAQTKTAVENFQRFFGKTVTGIANQETINKLNEVYTMDKVIISSTYVNVRKQATTSSPILGKLYKGDMVLVYGVKKVGNTDWYKIYFNGGFAYISSTCTKHTFIEIDIVSQTLRFYKNRKLVIDTPVTTGRTDGVHNTARGFFGIVAMYNDTRPNAHLRYQIIFEGYIGLVIHDSSWRLDTVNFNYYGGKVYKNLSYPAGSKYSGSNGCVNVPYEKIKIFYPMVETVRNSGYSMPIYVH